ncbi:MAG TPA: response regulator transcription factor [Gemmatimonadales bacterium]|nr:response regulator transcription factor [Gemmatimonadales bacterium]
MTQQSQPRGTFGLFLRIFGLALRTRTHPSPIPFPARAGDATPLVLISSSEPEISALAAFHLAKAGYSVSTATTANDALARTRRERPMLVVLDSALEDASGYDLLPDLRGLEETKDMGILLLTNSARDNDRIRGLMLGADDCVVKPFAPDELVLRVRAILRRLLAPPPPRRGSRLWAGPLTLDTAEHRVSVNGREIRLTATEFDLLRVLMQQEGRVQSRAQLLETVWGTKARVATRTVDMHVQRMRKKLGEAGTAIDAVRGTGYRFHAPVSERL